MNVFYKKNFYKKMNLKNPKTLRKCLENLHASVAIFKNADFSYSSLQH